MSNGQKTTSFMLQGLPNDGNVKTPDDIIEICTSLIATCTLQHAAVNFLQYDVYANVANYPLMLTGSPPTDKVSVYMEYTRREAQPSLN